jgi:hypothetical protein
MASHSRSSSFSSSTSVRPPVSPCCHLHGPIAVCSPISSRASKQVPATARLQRAMEAHAALQLEVSRSLSRDSPPPTRATSVEEDKGSVSSNTCTISAASVEDLANQLRQLWQRESTHAESRADSEAGGSSPSLPAALHKIGSNEKNELLLYMLEQQDSLRTQRSEVAALGEKIAAQLLQQQVRMGRTRTADDPPVLTTSWSARASANVSRAGQRSGGATPPGLALQPEGGCSPSKGPRAGAEQPRARAQASIRGTVWANIPLQQLETDGVGLCQACRSRSCSAAGSERRSSE